MDYFNYLLSTLLGKDMSDPEVLEGVMLWAKLPEKLYETKKL